MLPIICKLTNYFRLSHLQKEKVVHEEEKEGPEAERENGS